MNAAMSEPKSVKIMPCLGMQNGRVVKGVRFNVIAIPDLKRYLREQGVAVS